MDKALAAGEISISLLHLELATREQLAAESRAQLRDLQPTAIFRTDKEG